MFSNLFFNFLTVVTTSAVANATAEKDTSEVCAAPAHSDTATAWLAAQSHLWRAAPLHGTTALSDTQ